MTWQETTIVNFIALTLFILNALFPCSTRQYFPPFCQGLLSNIVQKLFLFRIYTFSTQIVLKFKKESASNFLENCTLFILS